jgi:hypothetical protein
MTAQENLAVMPATNHARIIDWRMMIFLDPSITSPLGIEPLPRSQVMRGRAWKDRGAHYWLSYLIPRLVGTAVEMASHVRSGEFPNEVLSRDEIKDCNQNRLSAKEFASSSYSRCQ